jgi:uncharacterized membrane protein
MMKLYLIMRDSGRRISAIAAESIVPAKTTAEEVLDERYAKGELTREIYLQMKEDLKKS